MFKADRIIIIIIIITITIIIFIIIIIILMIMMLEMIIINYAGDDYNVWWSSRRVFVESKHILHKLLGSFKVVNLFLGCSETRWFGRLCRKVKQCAQEQECTDAKLCRDKDITCMCLQSKLTIYVLSSLETKQNKTKLNCLD